MKTFDIDEDLYAKFKSKCVLNKKSVSKVVEGLMTDYVDEEPGT